MSSTVTTTTVTTVAALGGALALGLVAVLALMAFLAVREVAGSGRSPRFKAFARAMNIGVVPLFLAFAVIIGVKVADALAS
ncbi:MAG: hypothetical protein ACE5IZ_07590 [Dehalococcoidia bacterium]